MTRDERELVRCRTHYLRGVSSIRRPKGEPKVVTEGFVQALIAAVVSGALAGRGLPYSETVADTVMNNLLNDLHTRIDEAVARAN